jgi:hypothetical protein
MGTATDPSCDTLRHGDARKGRPEEEALASSVRRTIPAAAVLVRRVVPTAARVTGVAKNILEAATDEVGCAFGSTAQAHARNEADFRPVRCGDWRAPPRLLRRATTTNFKPNVDQPPELGSSPGVLDLSSAELRFTTHRGFDQRLDISDFLPIRKRRTRSMAEGSNKKLLAQSEVALHASRKDCWVVINGKVGVQGDRRYLLCDFLGSAGDRSDLICWLFPGLRCDQLPGGPPWRR